MIVKQTYRIGLEEVGRKNLATNKAILIMMEDIAGFHSSQTGSGLLDIEKNKTAWVLLNWKVKIINRPKYNEIVEISTWSAECDKVSATRDFEIRNCNGEILVIGTSRWIYMDLEKRRPLRITEDIIEPFESELGKHVFNEKIEKINIPDTDFEENTYKILRRDMDYLGHMHNISYLDIAYDTMSEDLYNGPEFNQISIEYRKEISDKEIVQTHLYNIEKGCIITINTDTTNAVVSLEY